MAPTAVFLAGCAPTAQPPLGTPVTAERAFQAFKEICLDHGPSYLGSIAEYRKQGFQPYAKQYGADVVLHPSEDMTFLVLYDPRVPREAKCSFRFRTGSDPQDVIRLGQRYGRFAYVFVTGPNRIVNLYEDRDGVGFFFITREPLPSGPGFYEMEMVALNYSP